MIGGEFSPLEKERVGEEGNLSGELGGRWNVESSIDWNGNQTKSKARSGDTKPKITKRDGTFWTK